MSWVPVTNKRKTGLPQEEVLVKLAKTFPATTTIALQQASSTVTGRQALTPSEARRKRQKKFTTQGRSRKSVSVYSSPPFTWKEDVIYNQINGRLGTQDSGASASLESSLAGGHSSSAQMLFQMRMTSLSSQGFSKTSSWKSPQTRC